MVVRPRVFHFVDIPDEKVSGDCVWVSLRSVGDRRQFRKLQKPTLGSPLKRICIIFIEELRGVSCLPILLNVGYPCTVAK